MFIHNIPQIDEGGFKSDHAAWVYFKSCKYMGTFTSCNAGTYIIVLYIHTYSNFVHILSVHSSVDSDDIGDVLPIGIR